MKNAIFCLFFVTLLSACATPYDQKKSVWGGGVGFSHTQLGPDVWQVDFTGNTHTDRETTKKYVLRHAAEIATKEGYPYFKAVDGETARDIQGSSHVGYFGGLGGGESYANAKTSTTMTVQLLKQKEGNSGIVYDAQFLLSSIPTK